MRAQPNRSTLECVAGMGHPSLEVRETRGRIRLPCVTDRAEDARRFFLQQFTGFNEVPPDAVQEIYAKALIMCARGDGEFHPEEKAWVRGYFSATGAPQHVIDLVDTFDGAPDEILEVLSANSATAASAARNLVFDALRVCESDGELAPAERASIHRMAERMGLDAGAVRQVEAAYEVYKSALANKMAVLFPGETPFT